MGTLTIRPTYDTTSATTWTQASIDGVWGAGTYTKWQACLLQVISDIEAAFSPSNSVDVSINFGFGYVAFSSMGAGLGNSEYYIDSQTYATIKTKLQSLAAPDSVQTQAFGGLPGSDPIASISGGSFQLTDANSAAIGASTENSGNLIGWVGIGTSYAMEDSVDGQGGGAGTYSLYGVLWHEITEVLGRWSLPGGNSAALIDLFTYSGTGTRNTTNSGARYLSPDGGTTNYADFNQAGWSPGSVSADPGDLASSDTSAFAAYDNDGNRSVLRQNDYRYMAMVGWTLSTAGKVLAGLTSDTGIGAAAGTGGAIAAGKSTAASPGLALGAGACAGGGSETVPTRGIFWSHA